MSRTPGSINNTGCIGILLSNSGRTTIEVQGYDRVKYIKLYIKQKNNL